MLTGAFAPHERGRALGLNAIIVSLGISVGPILGGFLTGALSWRWIFYVNVPIGIIGFIRDPDRAQGKLQTQSHEIRSGGCSLTGNWSGLYYGCPLLWSGIWLAIAIHSKLFIVSIIALKALPFVEGARLQPCHHTLAIEETVSLPPQRSVCC